MPLVAGNVPRRSAEKPPPPAPLNASDFAERVSEGDGGSSDREPLSDASSLFSHHTPELPEAEAAPLVKMTPGSEPDDKAFTLYSPHWAKKLDLPKGFEWSLRQDKNNEWVLECGDSKHKPRHVSKALASSHAESMLEDDYVNLIVHDGNNEKKDNKDEEVPPPLQMINEAPGASGGHTSASVMVPTAKSTASPREPVDES